MAIDRVNTLARPTPADVGSGGATNASGISRDAFMQLLVAQLKNQDPLDPTDARDFVTQLSQLTGVEQLVTMTQRVQALEIAMAGMANTQATELVGKTVTADSSSLRLDEHGTARGAYTLEGRAESVTVRVLDPDGRVVRTLELGAAFPGTHAVEWDGNLPNGERAAPGRYRMEIVAADERGQAIATSTRTTGVVRSVSYENGYPELDVGSSTVLLGDVLSVSTGTQGETG